MVEQSNGHGPRMEASKGGVTAAQQWSEPISMPFHNGNQALLVSCFGL
jgi:hypothetical protein